ncbi:MAG: cell division protein FtsW [Pseudomonadota bacterium]|nr:cell division protein FtsW [Pseudomonadota bacterium]
MLYTARAPQPSSELDYSLLWLVLGLLAIGLVMVYSASIAIAEAARYTGSNGEYYLIRQGVFIAIGLVAGAGAFLVPMRVWQQAAPYLFLVGLLLLLVVLIPGIGREVNGSRRWIPLGFANLQPSELMKLLAVLYAADYTFRKIELMQDFMRGFLPMAGVMMLVGSLLLLEPDFGAFVVIVSIAMGILFLGGLNWKVFAALAGVLLAGFALLIFTSEYRMQRILGFMDPFADPYGKGYQLSHALIAFGRGEWLGLGLGGSVEKLFYLPEAHTDFLLAVIAEEFGFVGVAIIIGLFAWLIVKAFLIGRRATELERYYNALVAQGIGVWIGVQALINMGVNVGLLPTKGLTLPFLSFGGSGIVANCLAIAVLLRVDWECRQMGRGKTF